MGILESKKYRYIRVNNVGTLESKKYRYIRV